MLLLDEPTNHLDLEMREALAEALSDFDGAIVMVSHDRHLIGLVCDTFWRVADGVVEPFAGDLDQYAAWLRSRPGAQGTKPKAAETKPAGSAAEPQVVGPAVPPGVAVSASAKPAAGRKPANPYKLAEAEKRVGDLEAALADLDARMADPAVFSDAGKLADLGRRRDRAAAELADAEQAWMALMDDA